MMDKTEKDAAEYICHKLIAYSPARPRHCIGARCMAWTWLKPKKGREMKRFSGSQSPLRYEEIEVGDCGLKASMGPEISS